MKRWFLTISAKSKGYISGFHTWNSNKYPVSFTKQTALAQQYTTEEQAREAVKKEQVKCDKEVAKNLKYVEHNEKLQKQWDSMTFEQQEKFAKQNNVSPFYNRYYANVNTTLNDIQQKKHDREKREAYNKFKFIKPNSYQHRNIDRKLELKKFLQEKIIYVEQDIEIKFKDKCKYVVEWRQRGENETAGYYCNVCGGAVPNIPQFHMYSRRGRGASICAICMTILADEAKRQAGKIPDDIMELYERDKFLKDLG